MRAWYVVLALLVVYSSGCTGDAESVPPSFRLHGWITAEAEIYQDDSLILGGPVSFAVFNGVGKAHSYWGALCEAGQGKLVCMYQFTDYTYGPNYWVEVELDGWADLEGAEFDVWQRYPLDDDTVGEIHRHYEIAHVEIESF